MPGADERMRLAEARRAETYRQRVVTMLDRERFQQSVDQCPGWLDAREWDAVPLNKKQAKHMHSAVVTTSLYGRIVGQAAELEDHATSGRNMTTRSTAGQSCFVG
jgi:hypothetical protein